jgi:hypothetical protein
MCKTHVKVSGTVRKVFQNEKNYSVYVNVPGDEKLTDTRFGGFGKCPYKEDEEVSFLAEMNVKDGKTYWNISKKKDVDVPVVEKSIDSLPENEDTFKQMAINRAVAWKVAAIFYQGNTLEKLRKLKEEVEADLNAGFV